MLPVVSKPNRNTSVGNGYSLGSSTLYETGRTKQKAPYNIPTGYKRLQGSVDEYLVVGRPAGSKSDILAFTDHTADQYGVWANNSAYEKFRDAVQSDAMAYVNIHERDQTINSALKRFSQLYLFTLALLRRSPRQAAQALGVNPSRVPKGVWRRTKLGAKGLGSTWLEWHFGWDPLIKDIATTVNILNQAPIYHAVRVKGRRIQNTEVSVMKSAYNDTYLTREISVRTTCGAFIQTSSYNRSVATQLGLTNPLAIAWELVPYSFVVDWFANVGTYLQSFTDFDGLSVTKPFTSTVAHERVTYVMVSRNFVNGKLVEVGRCYQKASAFQVARVASLPAVKLGFRPPRRIGGVRGFTAIALLLNLMRK